MRQAHERDTAGSPDHKRCLIYDGECRLCLTAKQELEPEARKQGVTFLPYQSDEAARLLGKEYHPGRPTMAYFIDEQGHVHRGLDAFIPLLSGLPGGRLLLALWRIPVLRPFAYVGYRLVARYRYRWFGEAHH